MTDVRVSVVLPVYNAERYLGEALDSVLGQSLAPDELIVVDDGSTDRTREIVRERASARVRYHYQPNQGTGAARNAGVELARGVYLAHMDADDIWQREKLALQVAALDADPQLDAVTGHLREFHSPDLSAELRARVRPPRPLLPGRLLQAMLFRREAHLRVGAFETHWRVGQDMSWMLRAIDAGLTLRVLPEIVVHRRLHAANKGIVESAHLNQRLHILKAALERRRAKQAQEGGG